MKSAFKPLITIILVLFLSACASTPTGKSARTRKSGASASSNACVIFKIHPTWYWEALTTYNRWRVPISVQMAIMQRESDFQAGARPPKKQLFGFIPWGNITSAYGYAQALNGTWAEYQRETGSKKTQRDKFGDSSDFIGWYCSKANRKLGLALNNAYALYLAYHEGLGGYANKSYLDKPWLLQVAAIVQQHANTYRAEISRCKYSLPKVPLNRET